MRGKVLLYVVLQIWDRITPAYAGKRFLHLWRVDTIRDHPRLCGEKHIWETIFGKHLGSPPPMRGKAL